VVFLPLAEPEVIMTTMAGAAGVALTPSRVGASPVGCGRVGWSRIVMPAQVWSAFDRVTVAGSNGHDGNRCRASSR